MPRPADFILVDPPVLGDPDFAAKAQAFLGDLPSFTAHLRSYADWIESEIYGELPNGTAAAPSLKFEIDTDLGLYRAAADQLGFTAGGTKRALMSTTAFTFDVNVGIGTTAPTEKFHLEASTGYFHKIKSTSPTGFVGTRLDNDSGASAYQAIYGSGYVGGTTLGVGVGGYSMSHLGGNMAIGTGTAGKDVRFFSGGTTERLRIASDGKIGIGTNAPAHTLDVDGGATATVARFKNGNSGGTVSTTHGELVVESADGNMGFQFLGTNTSNQQILFGDASSSGMGKIEYAHSGDYMALHTQASERLRIDSAGRVSVGTSSTGYRFQAYENDGVADTVNAEKVISRFTGKSGSNTRHLSFSTVRRDAGSAWQGTGMRIAGLVDESTSVQTYLEFMEPLSAGRAISFGRGAVASSVEWARINDTGLGVGVDPAATLHLYSEGVGSSNRALIHNPSTSTQAQSAVTFRTVSEEWTVFNKNDATKGLAFFYQDFPGATNRTIPMRMMKDGKVGINLGLTAAPQTELHVGRYASATPQFTTDVIAVFDNSDKVQGGIGWTGVGIVGDNSTGGGFIEFGSQTTPNMGAVVYSNGGKHMLLRTNALDTVKIDGTSQSILMGKSTPDAAVVGSEIHKAGHVSVTRTSATAVALNRLGTNGSIIDFRKDTVLTGSISVTATNTAYNTSSDYRLKNEADAPDAFDPCAKVAELAAAQRWYSWKNAPDKVDLGWFAHELQAIHPDAVTGEKDAVDEDGEMVTQGRDDTKLIPILTAALDKALKRIDDLEARVKQLEPNV